MLIERNVRFHLSYLAAGLAWVIARSSVPFAAARVDPEAAVLVTVWTLAGVGLIWLGLSVLFWAAEHRWSGTPMSILQRLTLPGSRRLAQGMLAVSLTIVPACGQASKAPILTYVGEASTTTLAPTPSTTQLPTTTTTTSPLGVQTSVAPPSSTTNPDADPKETPPGEDSPSEPVSPDDATEPEPSTHTVMRGEHLWSIASDILTIQGASDPTTDEIADFWVRLVDANRSLLSSGDPNLVFPGEMLAIPS